MARPQKAGVDYFSHDVDTNGKTLFTLEATYGNDGYAFWFKLLELLGKQDGLYYDCREEANTIYLAARAHISVELALEMLDILAKLEAIDAELWQERIIWCQKFVNRLQDVYTKRRRELPQKPLLRGENSGLRAENNGSGYPADQAAPQTPQRKAKQRKAQNNKPLECGQGGDAAAEPSVAISLPLAGGGTHEVSSQQVEQWQELYPQVNIIQELRKMKGWLQANTRRRKAAAAIEPFIVSWLAREQDRQTAVSSQDAAGTGAAASKSGPAGKAKGKYAEIYDKY